MSETGVENKEDKQCNHQSQRLLVIIGSKLLYQCEKCKDVIVAEPDK